MPESNTSKERYLGSARFYSHLIVATLAVLITLPMGGATILAMHTVQLTNDMTYLTAQNQELAIALKDAQDELSVPTITPPPEPVEPAPEPEPEPLPSDEIDVPDYQALFPDMYANQPYAPTDETSNTLYLTFDDGPSRLTDDILDILDETGTKGTFFIYGENLNDVANQDRVLRMVDGGHGVAIHTNTHRYKEIYASVEAYLEDFYAVWSSLKELTGVGADVFRFPGGSINSYNGGIYQEIIAEMTRRGFVYYDWNTSSADATGSHVPVETILENSFRGKKFERVILLMHDSGTKQSTVDALPEIIRFYTELGYESRIITPDVKPAAFGYKF